jgi:hypothetical protein
MKKIILVFILTHSILNSYSQDPDSNDLKQKSVPDNMQMNSLYIGSHILTIDAFYERIIPIKNKVGLLAGVGIIQSIGFDDDTNPVVKFGCIIGGYKHFFETGINVAPLRNDINLLLPLIGYRYQHPKGFLFRFDFMAIVDSGTYADGSGSWTELYPMPGLTLGYSF